MPYPKTHSAIKAMILKAVLYVPMARAIVRRAGIRQFASPGTLPAALPLWTSGSLAANNFGYTANAIDKGAYLYPPYALPPTRQLTLTNLTNIAYIRVLVTWIGYSLNEGIQSRVAFVPVYTNNMAPETLEDWIAPDAQTLAQWDSDLVAGTASWPPTGAALDPVGAAELATPVGVIVTGVWATPPVEVLENVENVLLGVAVLIRNGVVAEIITGDTHVQGAIAPVSDAFNARFID